MDRSTPAWSPDPSLTQQLANLTPDQFSAFLQQHGTHLDAGVAWELKTSFDACESSDPDRAISLARLLEVLGESAADPECRAVVSWTRGMADQLEGNLPASLVHLQHAETTFLQLEMSTHAASTLISKLFSLAMLGRYDEALRTGMRARAIFLRHGDSLAAGKIEQNLGNIYFRRDEYRKAEQLYRTARKRFLLLDDSKQLAQIDNCLASALTWQHRFQAALDHYEQALGRATVAGQQVTQAEIESNLGGLMLFQARYDRALDYLERARRRYAGLGLEHEAAISEKELAEAYLELNLIPEALALLQRLLPTFAALGMQADLAAVFTGFARACIASQRDVEAQEALAMAYSLYEQEQNEIGVALTRLVEAQRLIGIRHLQASIETAQQAELAFAQGDTWEWLLRARTLRAEAHYYLGEHTTADALYTTALTEAQQRGLPQIELRCLAALGSHALAHGDRAAAARLLDDGLAKFEALRATLPSEEFRLSFRGDQTTLFDGLIALALEDGHTVDALNLVERARSHTLLELVDGTIPVSMQPRDEFETDLVGRLTEMRSELNWFYHQLHRLPTNEEQPSAATLAQLRQGANKREQEIAEIVRQLQQRSDEGGAGRGAPQHLPLGEFQRQLGGDTALVEYYLLHDHLLAFVVTGEGVHVVENLAAESHITGLVRQLRFQIDTLRNGGHHLHHHMPQLVERCNSYLHRLYTALIQPLAQLVAGRRLVIVPYGALHYVPFHALHTGCHYLIEQGEVCIAPSTGVLYRCLQQGRSQPLHPVLIGVPDERMPLVGQEIAALHALMPDAEVRLGASATLEALYTMAPHAGVLHLACHGQFRPDNPLFSALRLSDGWLTARDAYGLRLNCSLVTLSACETGINAVTPGDELLGLVRGFFAAGAPALLVSLWPVDDATTVQFMQAFYGEWLAGSSLAHAHRTAQLTLLEQSPHPFYWSPFVLFGRWY